MYFIQQLISLTPTAVLTGSMNIFLNRIRKKRNLRYDFFFTCNIVLYKLCYFSQCYEEIRHLEEEKKEKKGGGGEMSKIRKAVCNRKFLFRMYIYKVAKLAVCKT